MQSDQHYHVIVIGSGFAGLAAALEAAFSSPESKVVIVEKMPVPGGNSVMNTGQVSVVNSEAQQKAGIQDSVELMMKDMIKAGGDLNHPKLLKTMIEAGNDVIKWTQEEFGVQYGEIVVQLGGHSVPRTLFTVNKSGNDIINPMLDKVKSLPNTELLLDTPFHGFLMEGGRVKGIQVKIKGQEEPLNLICSKGVVLASGGFGADVAFRSIQNPSFGEKLMTSNQPGATAEVIREALKLGAMAVQLDRILLAPWTCPDEQGLGKAPFFCIGAGFPYGILVDPSTAKRFANEMGNSSERSLAIVNQVGHPVICITDSNGASHSLIPVNYLPPTVQSFGSMKELAESYGMDPIILQETVESYNHGVAQGKDEFGKAFPEDLTPINNPPFYAVRIWPKVHHCMGGLHINTQAQVQHVDGHAIPGLYAAGEVAGGIHGGDPLGGCSTLDCLAFGRIAGRNVVISMDDDEYLTDAMKEKLIVI